VARAKPLFLAASLTIAAIVGLRLLVELRGLLILLFVSMVLAAAMSRPAAVLERRGVPRGLAVAIVQLTALAALLAVGYVVPPPLLDEVAGFAHRVPSYIDRFQGLRRSYAKLRSSYPELGSFDSEVSKLADRVGSVAGRRLINLPLGVASLLYQALTVVAFSTLLVMRRERIMQALLPLVAPHRREHTVAVADKIWERIGAYVRAKLIVMTIVGVLMYLALLVLDVPFAVPLAVIVAFGEVIPQIGPWIARVPLPRRCGLRGADDPRTDLPRVVRAREPQGLRHLAPSRGRAAQARPAARAARRARRRDPARRSRRTRVGPVRGDAAGAVRRDPGAMAPGADRGRRLTRRDRQLDTRRAARWRRQTPSSGFTRNTTLLTPGLGRPQGTSSSVR
jgi:predicted PurR-regulated permease PerM